MHVYSVTLMILQCFLNKVYRIVSLEKASTVINGIDCCWKRHRLLLMASTVVGKGIDCY